MNTRRQFIRRALQGALTLSCISFLGTRAIPEIVQREGVQGLTLERIVEAKRMMDREMVDNPPVLVVPEWVIGEAEKQGVTHKGYFSGMKVVAMKHIPEEGVTAWSEHDGRVLKAFFDV